MWRTFSIPGVIFLLGLGLASCTSVSSTADYYVAYTTKTYPPKPKEAVIPILGKAPSRPHRIIGRLAFSTSRGFKFLRESMLYNARANGADAVVLNDTASWNQLGIVNVPPSFNYYPVAGPVYYGRGGCATYGTTWIPSYQPGYSYPVVTTISAIDSEMIVFE